jgi:thymidylate synthase
MNEIGYLNLLRNVIDNGDLRQTRNGNTLSIFGPRLEFNLKDQFPLITTKKMFIKGIFSELLWFLNGKTDNKILQNQGVHIWDGNSSREYLDKRGLYNYDEGDCGPIYGFQWRRYNCNYLGKNVDISEIPINTSSQDQLMETIRLINEDPMSRRIIINGWNPCQMKEMCLEPCHVLYQFYVRIIDGNKYLSCHLYQRSADLFLGVPFNIASASLLTYILSSITNCKPDRLIISYGDAHIYENHIDQVKLQLIRSPLDPPQIIMPELSMNNLHNYNWKDFKIINYNCYDAIKADMIV